LTFPHHGNHWAEAQEVAQAVEEWACAQVIVVLGGEFLGGDDELDGYQLVTFAFKAANDF